MKIAVAVIVFAFALLTGAKDTPKKLAMGEICELTGVRDSYTSRHEVTWSNRCSYLPRYCMRVWWKGSDVSIGADKVYKRPGGDYWACWDSPFKLEAEYRAFGLMIDTHGRYVHQGSVDDRFPIRLRYWNYFGKDLDGGFDEPAIRFPEPTELEH